MKINDRPYYNSLDEGQKKFKEKTTSALTKEHKYNSDPTTRIGMHRRASNVRAAI
jgi:hypothetical protein